MKAVVIGASSGIGRALAMVLSQQGCEVGLAARRVELLEEVARELPGPSVVRQIDVALTDDAMARLGALLQEMGEVDLVVLSAGIGFFNKSLEWDRESRTLGVNVNGFAAMANVAFNYFAERGRGHLVGISSVIGVRGSGLLPAYSASKAFVSNYLEGLRLLAHARRLEIAVTDVRPGFVDTPMTRGQKGMFWVSTATTAAAQIARAITAKKRTLYVTRRWALVAWLLKRLPEFLYRRLF